MTEISDILFLLMAVLLLGYFTYVAWLRPGQYREYLRQFSRLYEKWDRSSVDWITSNINFWLTRVGVTVGFLGCLYLLFALVWRSASQ